MENKDNPFKYRIIPKNDWELVLWAVTDSLRLSFYEDYLQLKRWQKHLRFIKIYCFRLVPVVVVLATVLWLLGITLIATTDILNHTPLEWWKKEVLADWQNLDGFAFKWQYLVEKQIIGLAFGLSVGLAVGLAGGLAFGLAVGLAYGLAVGLAVGLAFGLAFGLAVGLVFLLKVIPTYFSASLQKNPYLTWVSIDTSILLEKKFIEQTQAQPNLGLQFADFLWRYRPRNSNLAVLLAHVGTAELWKYAALNLDEKALNFPTYEQKRFIPFNLWQTQLNAAKNALVAAGSTNLISTRVTLFKEFIQSLEDLRQSTLQIPHKSWRDQISMTRRINWYAFYTPAVEAWLKVAREKLSELEQIAQMTEPIATNRYQTGGALSPQYNEAVFMKRDDLIDKVSTLLYTTQNFSVFFLQGQRRVGKTSLIKFLPKILGNRYETVYFDLQGSINSIPDFLQKWHAAFALQFNLKDAVFEAQATWSETFKAMQQWFQQTAQERAVKIILVLDEYEELQKHLAKDPEQAEALLGAMRHFTQHQSQLSIMFVGLQFFSELKNPNWNEFFPQSVPIKVAYLNHAKTFQLIEVSGLDFEEGMKEHIWQLTQGHPSLIQKICYELVQIANREGRRRLSATDLDESLRTMIYTQDNGVTDIFWTQNCALDIDKDIVRAIVDHQPLPPDSKQRLRRLIEYGFILEENQNYRLRVPIFEEWVKKFG